jgi:hypothetical protein
MDNSAAMSYDDAMHSAKSGIVNAAVIAAIERELASVEGSGQKQEIAKVRLNLAVAFIHLGNNAPSPEKISEYYDRYMTERHLFVSDLLDVCILCAL